MKKTIYLYIGMGKSGSSSIQYFLNQNKEALRKYGVLLPVIKNPERYYVPLEEVNFELLFHDFNKNIIDKITYEERFKNEFEPQIQEAVDCDKIILYSDEIFHYMKDTSFTDVFFEEGYDVKVIVYIRRPSEYITSLWGEDLKPHTPVKIADTLEEKSRLRKIPYGVVLKLIEKLGKDNVIIRPFEKEQWKNNNLIEDWLNCIELDYKEEFINTPSQNPSYNRNTNEILRLVNLLSLPKEIAKECRQEIVNITPDEKPKVIETLSDEQIEGIENMYCDTLKEIANCYGKESLFINPYPSCYKKERPVYDKVVITLEQVKVIDQAILKDKKEQEIRIAQIKKQKKKHKIIKKLIKVLPYFMVKKYFVD